MGQQYLAEKIQELLSGALTWLGGGLGRGGLLSAGALQPHLPFSPASFPFRGQQAWPESETSVPSTPFGPNRDAQAEGWMGKGVGQTEDGSRGEGRGPEGRGGAQVGRWVRPRPAPARRGVEMERGDCGVEIRDTRPATPRQRGSARLGRGWTRTQLRGARIPG